MTSDNDSNNMHINLSASGEKIKYYDYDDDTCIFEILDDNSSCEDIDMECNSIESNGVKNQADDLNSYCENYRSDKQDFSTSNDLESDMFNYYNGSCEKVKGEIVVVSVINCAGKNKCLEGAKINLYKLNGICPMFVESHITNKQGKAVFSNLPEGCYRVIEIVNKNYFEKPKYINWNEVNINNENTDAKILVMNNLKKICKKNCRYK